VEFVLVCVVLFPLLFGILEYAWGFWEQQSAQASAAQAARLASLGVPASGPDRFAQEVACIARANGVHGARLTDVQVAFSSDAAGLVPMTPADPTGYVTLTLTYHSALSGVLPSPFTDDQGDFTSVARARLETLSSTDLRTSLTRSVEPGGC
jgi:Flp pilus assembly protein TadG